MQDNLNMEDLRKKIYIVYIYYKIRYLNVKSHKIIKIYRIKNKRKQSSHNNFMYISYSNCSGDNAQVSQNCIHCSTKASHTRIYGKHNKNAYVCAYVCLLDGKGLF